MSKVSNKIGSNCLVSKSSISRKLVFRFFSKTVWLDRRNVR